LAQTRRLRVSVTDAAGGGVAGLTVTAELERPATARFDRKLDLVQTGLETYEGDVPELEAGWWTVDLQASRGEAHYKARRRLWITP
jgi:nitrogen fixation protein FixH